MITKSSRKPQEMPDKETRERQAKRRLGSENPACCHCGIADWRVLERHHVAGQAFDDLTVIQCKNCHTILSDAQHDHPPFADHAPTMLDRIGRMLLGLADFFGQLGSKLKMFGEYLINLARFLHANGVEIHEC